MTNNLIAPCNDSGMSNFSARTSEAAGGCAQSHTSRGFTRGSTRFLFSIVLCTLALSGCETLPGLSKSTDAGSQETGKLPAPVNQRSAQPIKDLPITAITEAQQRLKILGYNIGPADGIWGPRSAGAIRSFERRNGLSTAHGFLSELNLHMLETLTRSDRQRSRRASSIASRGIKAKLDRTVSLNQGPQLVFADREYDLHLKPNPYSERIVRLSKGVGIYVLSEQEGWFEVESENQQKGFIKAD